MREMTLSKRILRAAYNYLLFFLLVAFLVTCSTMLFVTVLSESLGIELSSDNIQTAAKITFVNVVALSILFTAIDAIRRKVTTERVTKHITTAAKEIVRGDFNVRIAPISSFSAACILFFVTYSILLLYTPCSSLSIKFFTKVQKKLTILQIQTGKILV